MDTNYLKYGKKYPSILQHDKVFQDSWIPVTTINAKEHHNPQDAFGQAHNLAVVDFFQINSASTKGEFINRAFEFFNVPRQFRNLIYEEKGDVFVGRSDYDRVFVPFRDKNPMIYQSFYDLLFIVEDSRSLQGKIEAIVELEAQWMLEKIMSQDTKLALTMSSIVRHSISLWHRASLEGNIPGTPVVFPRKIDWWGVGRGDLYGACLAGFTTANPFVALGWGAASSAIDAIDQGIGGIP